MELLKDDHFGMPSSTLQNGLEIQMFDLTNAARVKHGFIPLKWEEKARTSSRLHSQDMAANNYFNHMNLKGLSLLIEWKRRECNITMLVKILQ